MEISIPYRIRTEIPENGDIRRNKGGYRKDPAATMPAEGVEIIEVELCKDHILMLVSIPPKYSVSQIMGYLKGKSSLMIFDGHANLKYKYGNQHF